MDMLRNFYVATGGLLVVLSVPLILRLVGPNGWYGFRVKATLENPELWYDVNVYSGWRMLVTGLVSIFTAIGLSWLPGLTVEQYSRGCLVVAGTVLAVGLLQSMAYLRFRQRR